MALEKNYVSETDNFIKDLLKKKPELKEKQKALRSTWWDRGFIDPEEQKEFAESAAAKTAYAYFDYSHEKK